MVLRFVKQVWTLAYWYRHLRDKGLSNCIKRWIRYLCEVLLEVREQRLRLVG